VNRLEDDFGLALEREISQAPIDASCSDGIVWLHESLWTVVKVLWGLRCHPRLTIVVQLCIHKNGRAIAQAFTDI